MDKYKTLKVIGDGAYGIVTKSVNTQTGEIVAIKQMKRKYSSWDECINLRELKSLKKLNHPNIVKLKEVIRVNDVLYFVFEFCEKNLYQMVKSMDHPFPIAEIKNIMYQSFLGVSYIHKMGFFHRDIKPENLLLSNNYIKICDFGQAREIRSKPPYTDYISTRWYRAPECLVKSTNYNSPIDMFALGCLMAELFILRPLFPGTSEADQLFKICTILGTPTNWSEGHKLALKIGYRFPNVCPVPLQKILGDIPSTAIDLIQQMLRFEPQTRITASQALNHPFFSDFKPPLCISNSPTQNYKKLPDFSSVITKEHVSKDKEDEELLSSTAMKNILNELAPKGKGDASPTILSLNSSFESVASKSSKEKPSSKGSKGKPSSKNSKSHALLPNLPDAEDTPKEPFDNKPIPKQEQPYTEPFKETKKELKPSENDDEFNIDDIEPYKYKPTIKPDKFNQKKEHNQYEGNFELRMKNKVNPGLMTLEGKDKQQINHMAELLPSNMYTKDALEDLIDKKKQESEMPQYVPNSYGFFNKYKYS
jgi:protein kinase